MVNLKLFSFFILHMQSKENEKDAQKVKDETHNSIHVLQLKYNNPEGDITIGFRYSKYKDTDNSKCDPPVDSRSQSKKTSGGFFKQTRLMTWKNYLVFTRNIRPTIFQLLTPVMICILLLFLQGIVDNFSKGLENKNPEIIPLKNINKCKYPEDCTTIGYGIIVK